MIYMRMRDKNSACFSQINSERVRSMRTAFTRVEKIVDTAHLKYKGCVVHIWIRLGSRTSTEKGNFAHFLKIPSSTL